VGEVVELLMQTYPVLKDAAERAAYHERLQSDHDFKVWVEVLTLEEVEVDTLELLDGQVNLTIGEDGPLRTASITISDPEGRLSYGNSYTTDDDGVLWVNRLLRIMHMIFVPKLNKNIYTTVFVGLPTAVSREGAEVGLELNDKSAVSHHGTLPKSYKAGTNVRSALLDILGSTGEKKFRIPTTTKRTSKVYAMGMGDDALTPWKLFRRIAGSEMGWRSYYSADGYATCEPTNTAKYPVVVNSLLALPSASTSFTDFSNYAKVTSKRQIEERNLTKAEKKIADDYTFSTLRVSTAQLVSSHPLSAYALRRNGKYRYLPIVVQDDNLDTPSELTKRAISTLKGSSGIKGDQSYEIIPFFHMDVYDKFVLPQGVGEVLFDNISIPLGTGGNMTIGRTNIVSAGVTVQKATYAGSKIREKTAGGAAV
jgi:hypothetical protein